MLAKPQGFPRKLGGCAGLDPRLRSAVSAGVGDGERGLRRGLRAPGVGVRPKWVLEYSPSNKRIRYFVSITYVRTGLWTAHKFCGGGEKFIIIEHAKRFPDPRGGPGLPNTRNLSGQTHPGAIAPCLPQTLPAPQACPRSAAGRRAMSILSNRSSGATRRTGAHRLLARRVALSHRRVVQIEFDRPSVALPVIGFFW